MKTILLFLSLSIISINLNAVCVHEFEVTGSEIYDLAAIHNDFYVKIDNAFKKMGPTAKLKSDQAYSSYPPTPSTRETQLPTH